MRVWRCTELGFGDTWAVTNFLLRKSEEQGSPVKVFSVRKHFVDNVRQIKKHIASSGDIVFVKDTPNAKMSYCDPFRVDFLPTKKRWSCTSNIIAYQFDGRHLAQLKTPNYEVALKFLQSKGFLPINIGGYKSLDFVIDILSRCHCFMGCASGMSIVALNVGTPSYIVTAGLDKRYVRFMKTCQYYAKPIRLFRYTKSCVNTILQTKIR
jgi:hypothetical protein